MEAAGLDNFPVSIKISKYKINYPVTNFKVS